MAIAKRLLFIPIILLAIAAGYWWGVYSSKNPSAPTPTQNRLSRELSPYLRLHAHNPVDWYPWGEEALAKARREDKPIFLSVGYSSCYWCHVMERLVFSDPDIAHLMNQFFVNIKVDREERPDIDEIYMTATQLMTGHGGWPNSVFLTPDLKPFFAGTYFPPEDSHGRPGFPRVIQALHVAWQEKRQELEKQADQISQSIARIHTTGTASEKVERDLIGKAIDHIENRFDPVNGGLGTAPKFPPDHALNLLLTAYRQNPQAKYLAMVGQTLDHIALGGIRDHLGGGFHRYATDAQWRVPHFEKMLYNQALLTHNFLRAYQITNKTAYRIAAEEILDFVSREMTDSKGGFYSAIDAETEAEEGAYYTWTEQEIRQTLKKDADFFLSCYALAPMPEGSASVIYKADTDSALSVRHQTDTATLHARLSPLKEKLLNARSQRIRPLLDDKIITAWNGLMIGAYARAYEVLGHPGYLKVAQKAADFIRDNLRNANGDLYRIYREGQRKGEAYQEDYAFLIDGLLHLYRATHSARYLQDALSLSERMHTAFWDTLSGGFFFTQNQNEMIVRTKSFYDSALPSGNAVALHVLWELRTLTQNPLYAQRALALTNSIAPLAENTPGALLHFIHGTMMTSSPIATLSPDSLVTASATTLPPDSANTLKVNVRLVIASGWHIQASNPTDDYLIPTRLSLDTDIAEITQIDYPQAEDLQFPFAERAIAVYIDSLNVPLTLSFKTRPQTLSLLLTYQACDSTRCLSPQTQRIALNIK
ncbi:MAG: DUF255 domain-containing protein [Gemmatimonadetes bacterium]|nr:DUF255 domain-containing protein [Gemmatimonadota bacterium]